jgi:hypothetical protein
MRRPIVRAIIVLKMHLRNSKVGRDRTRGRNLGDAARAQYAAPLRKNEGTLLASESKELVPGYSVGGDESGSHSHSRWDSFTTRPLRLTRYRNSN